MAMSKDDQVGSIEGQIYIQDGQEGLSSYHFPTGITSKGSQALIQGEATADKTEGPYISYASAPAEWKLLDGSKPPSKKYFEDPKYDPTKRVFTGKIVWGENTFEGDIPYSWDFRMGFSSDLQMIESGEILQRDFLGSILTTSSYGNGGLKYKKELETYKIVMDVVQILNTGNQKDDVEEVLRVYLKEKRLLTKAFNNKTQRKKILLKIENQLEEGSPSDVQARVQKAVLSVREKQRTQNLESPIEFSAVKTDPDNGQGNTTEENPDQDREEYSLKELEAHPEKILHLVRLAEKNDFQLEEEIMDYLKDNESFRQSFEKVKIQSINAELDEYLKMSPSDQIRALHLLHTLGLLSATFRLNIENEGERGNSGYINSCMDKGLITLYVMNHFSSLDSDQSTYYHQNRHQIVTSCILSALFSIQQKESLNKTMSSEITEDFVQGTRVKSEIVKAVASQKTPSADQLKFIIEKWSNKYDGNDVDFNINMTIAKDYASSVRDFNKDFKIDEKKLQKIVDKYEGCQPKVIEQIEKKEEYKNEYMENLAKKKNLKK